MIDFLIGIGVFILVVVIAAKVERRRYRVGED
jgi:hypothetical protein